MLSKYIGEDGNYTREYLDHWEKMLEIIEKDLEAGTGNAEGIICNTFQCATSLTNYLLEFEKKVISETKRELNIDSILEEK